MSISSSSWQGLPCEEISKRAQEELEKAGIRMGRLAWRRVFGPGACLFSVGTMGGCRSRCDQTGYLNDYLWLGGCSRIPFQWKASIA